LVRGLDPCSSRYNFTAGTWSSAGNMASSRESFGIAQVDTDKALVAGGNNATSVLNSAEIYSFASNGWTAAPSFTTPRTLLRATALRTNGQAVGGKNDVLVTGGFDGSATMIALTQRYNAVASVWSSVGNLNPAVGLHTATQVTDGPVCTNCATNKVFVVGGLDSTFTARRSIQRFDPSTNLWNTSYGTLPIGIGAHCASLIESQIFNVFYGQIMLWSGGYNESGGVEAAGRTYAPPTFTNSGNGVAARYYQACGPAGLHQVLTTGGVNSGGSEVGIAEIWK
jgi:hypothetical protein